MDFSSVTQKNPYAQHPEKSSGGGFEGVLLRFFTERERDLAWKLLWKTASYFLVMIQLLLTQIEAPHKVRIPQSRFVQKAVLLQVQIGNTDILFYGNRSKSLIKNMFGTSIWGIYD